MFQVLLPVAGFVVRARVGPEHDLLDRRPPVTEPLRDLLIEQDHCCGDDGLPKREERHTGITGLIEHAIDPGEPGIDGDGSRTVPLESGAADQAGPHLPELCRDTGPRRSLKASPGARAFRTLPQVRCDEYRQHCKGARRRQPDSSARSDKTGPRLLRGSQLSNQTMTKGRLQSTREYLGLTTAALGQILSVRPDAVRKWETGREPIPRRVPAELAQLEEATEGGLTELVKTLKDSTQPTVVVYRTDAQMRAAHPEYAHFTARWWRHLVARALRAVPHAEVVSSETKSSQK